MMRLGKDKQAIFLAVFLIFSASALGQAGKSYRYQLDGAMRKSDVLTGNQSIIINYSISELNIESIVNVHGSFYRVNIPGHNTSVVPGKPELPVFSMLISIPDGSEYKVRISEVRSRRIRPSGKKFIGLLFPAQEGESKAVQQRKPEFKIDKTVYATRGTISSDTVKIESLGSVRNTRLANLSVFPVRYNPHSNVLEVITSMKIEITFSYPDGMESKSLTPESALFSESLNKGILNYNPAEVVPGFSDQPVKMIIITDTAFKKQLLPFIKWKTQKGFKVKVLYKGTGTGLAGNTYIQLKDTLTKIYAASSESDPPPEYLLIIGDVNRVPYYGTGNVTDMYYGEFTGNGDYIPEMFIGRLPVTDTTELKAVVSKIIQYEKFAYADTNKFYSHAIVTSGADGGYINYMNGQVNYAINNYINSSNKITGYRFYNNMSSADTLKKLINYGVSFANYTGHGTSEGWLINPGGSSYYLKNSDVASFTNKAMYPFVISNACQTARFNTANSFGNKMMVTPDKGAIGFIGCSYDSFWDEDYYWAVGSGPISADPTYAGTGLGAFDRLFHTHGEAASDWYYTMGQINFAGNLAVSSTTSPKKKYYWETYNLIGDPSVIPILGKPGAFTFTLPDTLADGIKSLSLNIDPFAYSAISRDGVLWDASFASASGNIVLDMPGISNDTCTIVITGQNKIPLIKKIHISEVKGEFINLNSTTINDIFGNNNARADFGEQFYLKFNVGNLGKTDATNLYAKITSASNYVAIDKDSVWIGTLAALSEKVLLNDLALRITGSPVDKSVITVNLMLKDQKTEKNFSIDIVIHAPQLQIISCIMDDTATGDGDLIADPGETFKLVFRIRNEGSSDISGQFSIVSPNTELSIPNESVKSGRLQFGQTTDIPILVKLSETVLSGSVISVSSTLDCNPFVVNKDFSFRIGRVRESFEASSLNIFPWINVSSIPWTITGTSSYDGSLSARSGAISHNGRTSLKIRTLYTSNDSLKFYYKVSSETDWDFLSFKLNGKELLKKSGEIPWTKKVVPVPAGYNQMEWVFSMDQSTLGGSNCAWIDLIDFVGSGSMSYIQKDLQVARIETPVQKDKFGMGTINVKVLNIGKDIIDGFNMAYTINNNPLPVKQFFENKVMPYTDTVTVSFKTKADLSKLGIYQIVTYGFDNMDDYLLNDTVRVQVENSEILDSIIIFPNPFDKKLTIFFNSKINDKLQISLTNLSGVKLYDIKKVVIKGKNVINLSDFELKSALYYLNIRGATINKTIPVLKINN